MERSISRGEEKRKKKEIIERIRRKECGVSAVLMCITLRKEGEGRGAMVLSDI